jgi:hypothetical protein
MIQHLSRLTTTFLFVCLLSAYGTAATYFTGNLNSAQENPPNASTATGFGRVTLNDTETQITASVYYSGLTSNVTVGHIHTAATGTNGPVTFNLAPTAGVTSGSVVNANFAVTAGQVADLKAGLMYFNIHTVNNPGGEVRGQLAVDSPYLSFMSRNQENPATTAPTAAGNGAISINAAGTQALVTMNWSGLTGNATVGHVHTGRSGVNGPVVCNLSPATVTAGSVIDFLCNFSPAQITSLRQGQFYLNLHTSANPGGEIRGQIQRRASTVCDYDGDSKTDFAVARPVVATTSLDWYIRNSSTGATSGVSFGLNTDGSNTRQVCGDFDGDGKDDVTVWRAGTQAFFYYLRSSDGTFVADDFGITSDDPRVVEDYDGDGKTDVAVFRSSTDTWYYRGSSNNAARNITFVPFGTTFANPGDFDGDGKGDFVDQQSAQWWQLNSSNGVVSNRFFASGAAFGVPGDYDGDGKVDIGATLTEGSNTVWYYLSSLNPAQNLFLSRREWGPSAGRTRTQGDYDGDGKTDVGVWLTGTGQFWYLSSLTGQPVVQQWGQTGDFALTGYNNR